MNNAIPLKRCKIETTALIGKRIVNKLRFFGRLRVLSVLATYTASATALDTRASKRGSNGLGIIYS